MLSHTDLDKPLTALRAAPHWYVAFSGGLDSTVLLHLLQRWCAANPGSPALSALHINHGLQAAADDWQQHCEAQCRDLQVPCVTRAVAVPARASIEAAARDARYRAFEEQLPPGAVLFMGHHLDDQVETFFLRLLRGAGVDGLSAMPRQRSLGAGLLVRPLLDCARAELQRYAAHHNLRFVEDPSNYNTALDRNFLRSEVLPLLGTRWPVYRQSVARAASHMAEAAAVVVAAAGVPETIRSVMGDPGLRAAQLLAVSQDIAGARLRAWLSAQGLQMPDQSALAEFLRQLRTAAGDGCPRLNCGTYALQRYRDGIYLEPGPVVLPREEPLYLSPGERCDVPGVGVLSVQQAQPAALCLLAGERLTVRWRQGGERCRLPGRAGSRSLKSLLQEWGVPPWWRDRLPLLYAGDELLAVGELARCQSTRWRALAAAGEQLWNFHWQRPVRTVSD